MKWHTPSAYREYMNSMREPKQPQWQLVDQIGYCQAWIVRDTANNRLCLQSYSTIVSYVEPSTKKVVHLGKWSVTTSHHQTRFVRELVR